MKYEAVIFDVSDTLIEYTPNYAKIFGDRMRSLGFEVSDEKAREISRVVNWTIGEQAQKEQCGERHISDEELNILLDKAALSCVNMQNVNQDQNLEVLRKIHIPKQEMSIISGVLEVLTNLKRNYRLAIVSNHYSWLLDYLKTIGIASYFESIVISDIVGVAKPNIRIMQIALDELGIEAKNCIYVGDQPFDVLCSKQIGMDCVWIASEEMRLPGSISYKEDYRIEKIIDLLNIL